MSGPLRGCRVVELGGIGPGPFCAAMFADMGADVVRIDRPSHRRPNARAELLLRGRRSVAIDLKRREGVDVLLRLLDEADAVIDLVTLLGLDPAIVEKQNDPDAWPQLREQFTEVFRSKSRSEWCDLLEGTDVCFAPVLTLSEAAEHPHNAHRATFVEAHGYIQPAPVPRFSRTPGGLETPPSYPGEHSDEVLKGWLSLSEAEIDGLREVGGLV